VSSPTSVPISNGGGKGKVTVLSDDASAEIYLDGKFVGDAPATFSLLAGTHTVEVKGAGGTFWKREVEILGDSEIKLNALLKSIQ
jgi:hypothetical protein